MNPPAERKKNEGIRKMFSEIPDTYERINHLLTFRLDTLWRKRMARKAAGTGGKRWIDLCTGTGETAHYLQQAAPEETEVFGVDFSLPMMSMILQKSSVKNIRCVLSDINQLPFESSTFDLATISFATRNINISREILTGAFRECHRILKPGGHFFNLETSQPSSRIIRRLFHFYIRTAVPVIGKTISGAKHPYIYLSRTIPEFYPPEVLSDILMESGFDHVTYKKKLFGAAAIHHATKFRE